MRAARACVLMLWAQLEHETECKEQFSEGNGCPLALRVGLGPSPFPLASAAASREEDGLCCQNRLHTHICKHKL